MARCDRCGFRRIGLARSRCFVCGTSVCENCQIVTGFTPGSEGWAPPFTYPWTGSHATAYHTVCSWECFDRWAWGFISRGHAPRRFRHDYALGGIRLHPAAARRAVAMSEDYRRRQLLEQARHLIEAEDHEGAAEIYQKLGMWKEAGDIRRTGRRQV